MKRVKKVIAEPNPLFMKWLEEFRLEAVNKDQSGLAKIFDMCIKSLGCYPLPFESALQCGALTGFGKTVCRRLEQKHQEYLAEVITKSTEDKQHVDFVCPLSPVTAPTFSPVRAPTLSPGTAPTSPLRQIQNLSPKAQKPNHKVPESNPLQERSTKRDVSSKSSVFDLPNNATENGRDNYLQGQEDKDMELAISLSQREVHLSISPEDKDLEFARQLQEQFNRENTDRPLNKSDPEVDKIARVFDSHNEDYDLPDIDERAPSVSDYFEDKKRSWENISGSDRHLDLCKNDKKLARQLDISLNHTDNDADYDLPEIQERIYNTDEITTHINTNLNTVDGHDLRPERNHSPPPVKRAKTKHDISVWSEEEEGNKIDHYQHIKDIDDPISKILAADPVLNPAKKFKKSKIGGHSKLPTMNNDCELSSDRIKDVGSPRSRTTFKKDYVPKTRSGNYAVLLTLHSKSQEDSYLGYLTKTDLQKLAQPLADQSFTMASVRTEFQYNAWSGVTTLVKHELVKRWGNPAKFDITDKGRYLAMKLLSAESGDVTIIDNEHSKEGIESQPRRSGNNKKLHLPMETESSLNRVPNDILGDLLATDPVINKDRKRKAGKSKTISSSQTSNVERDAGNTREVRVPRLGIEPHVEDTAPAPTNISQSNAQFDLGESIDWDQSFREPENTPHNGPSTSNISSTGTSGNLPLPLALQQMVKRQLSAEGPTVDRHSPEFVLSPGSFDILLCIDNTELKGGGSGGRQSLKTETVRHLKSSRANYDERNLNLGDFLWIAREKVAIDEGTFIQRQPRELVLPYIVERKRLDDLWMSVKDGRYEEQKFRMKGCGLGHLFYLIEDHPKQQQFWGRASGGGNLVTPEAIEQAIANTAVQEGFTIKKTADQKATIEYLTLFTRLLSRKYSGLTLSSCTQSDMADGLVAKRDTTLLQFKEFNDASRKTKKLQIQEVFAKILLRLKGLSADMAQAIVQQYPTPNSLMLAYSKADSEAEKLGLIHNIYYGLEAKRKIPKNVAEALFIFWTNPNLD